MGAEGAGLLPAPTGLRAGPGSFPAVSGRALPLLSGWAQPAPSGLRGSGQWSGLRCFSLEVWSRVCCRNLRRTVSLGFKALECAGRGTAPAAGSRLGRVCSHSWEPGTVASPGAEAELCRRPVRPGT